MKIRHSVLALLVLLALVAGACGSNDDDSASGQADVAADGDDAGDGDDAEDESSETDDDPETEGGGFPVELTSADHTATIEARPQAIVSLSPTATEMLFAIDAGDQVVAVDSFSYHPEEAPVTELSGFDPNVEAIIDFEPDLVVASGDRNDMVAGLDAVDVPVLILPAAQVLEDTYEQLELLGQATGNTAAADDLVSSMEADIDELTARAEAQAADRERAPTYYHELGPDLFSATSSTFVGQIYAIAGLENVADAEDPDGAAGGYPQLSAEILLDADPDLVFLADTKCCDVTVESFGERPGFEQLTAVQQGNVFEVDEDIASRWGPRIVELLEAVVDATASLELDEQAAA